MVARGRVRFEAAEPGEAPNQECGHEVIGGELRVALSPALRQQRALSGPRRLAAPWGHEQRLGRAFATPLAGALEPATAAPPDSVRLPRARVIDGAPHPIIEVLSPKSAANERRKLVVDVRWS